MISNSFHLRAKARDGEQGLPGTMYQRRYRSTASSVYTGALPTTENAPSGWGEVDIPSQISSTMRYRWVIMRRSDDGGTTWGSWSPPVIDAYMPEDGRSVSIKGQAVLVNTGAAIHLNPSLWPDPSQDDIVLENGTYAAADAQYWDDGAWSDDLPNGNIVAVGDCFLVDGHLWQLTYGDHRPGRWLDFGQIKGEPGENAVMYAIRLSTSSLHVDHKGIIGGALLWNVYRIEGGTETMVARTEGISRLRYVGSGWQGNWTYASLPQYSDLLSIGSNGIGASWDAYPGGEADSVAMVRPTGVELRFELNGVTKATLTVPLTIMGRMSRNLYYAGLWDSFSSQFVVTDYKAPYFAYTDNDATTLWAFVGDNGTYTRAQAGTPSAGNANWRQMANEFEYLITKVVFTDFAQLGSAIFNGDYMFSQRGVMLGFGGTKTVPGSEQYQNIDPTDVFGRSFVETAGTVIDGSGLDSNTYTQSVSYVDATGLTKETAEAGSYYSLKMKGSGDFEWRIERNGVPLATGAVSGSGVVAIANFYNGAANTLDLKVKANSNSSISYVYVRECKFVPNFAVNMLTGEHLGAAGNFLLESDGSIHIRGSVMEGVMEITPDNYLNYCFRPSWYDGGLTLCFDITRMGRLVRFTGDWTGIGAKPPLYINTLLSGMPTDYKFLLRGLADKKVFIFNEATGLTLQFVGGHMFKSDGLHLYTSFSVAAGTMAAILADYDIDNDAYIDSRDFEIMYATKIERIKWILKTPENWSTSAIPAAADIATDIVVI